MRRGSATTARMPCANTLPSTEFADSLLTTSAVGRLVRVSATTSSTSLGGATRCTLRLRKRSMMSARPTTEHNNNGQIGQPAAWMIESKFVPLHRGVGRRLARAIMVAGMRCAKRIMARSKCPLRRSRRVAVGCQATELDCVISCVISWHRCGLQSSFGRRMQTAQSIAATAVALFAAKAAKARFGAAEHHPGACRATRQDLHCCCGKLCGNLIESPRQAAPLLGFAWIAYLLSICFMLFINKLKSIVWRSSRFCGRCWSFGVSVEHSTPILVVTSCGGGSEGCSAAPSW